MHASAAAFGFAPAATSPSIGIATIRHLRDGPARSPVTPLPAERVAFPAGIGSRNAVIGRLVDGDRADAAAAPMETRPELGSMSFRRERCGHCSQALFEVQHAGLGPVRIEGIGKAG